MSKHATAQRRGGFLKNGKPLLTSVPSDESALKIIRFLEKKYQITSKPGFFSKFSIKTSQNRVKLGKRPYFFFFFRRISFFRIRFSKKNWMTFFLRSPLFQLFIQMELRGYKIDLFVTFFPTCFFGLMPFLPFNSSGLLQTIYIRFSSENIRHQIASQKHQIWCNNISAGNTANDHFFSQLFVELQKLFSHPRHVIKSFVATVQRKFPVQFSRLKTCFFPSIKN